MEDGLLAHPTGRGEIHKRVFRPAISCEGLAVQIGGVVQTDSDGLKPYK